MVYRMYVPKLLETVKSMWERNRLGKNPKNQHIYNLSMSYRTLELPVWIIWNGQRIAFLILFCALALCLSLVILAICTNTEVNCEGKKGDAASLSSFLLCHRYWGVSQPNWRNSAYIPKWEELQVLCFENTFQTNKRRKAYHKWLHGIKFICYRRTENLATPSEVWRNDKWYQTWSFNMKL